MALIKCSKCGKEISDQADVCVYCCCPVSITLERAFKITKCPECGAERNPGDTQCYCGLIYENYKKKTIDRILIYPTVLRESYRGSIKYYEKMMVLINPLYKRRLNYLSR